MLAKACMPCLPSVEEEIAVFPGVVFSDFVEAK